MNRLIFLAMVLTFAVVICLRLFGSKQNEGTFGGVACSMSAFSFGDDVYVSISMKRSGTKQYRNGIGPKTVDFSVTAVDSDGDDSSTTDTSFDFEDSGEDEICRMTFSNYGITKIKAVATCGDESGELVCPVVAK